MVSLSPVKINKFFHYERTAGIKGDDKGTEGADGRLDKSNKIVYYFCNVKYVKVSYLTSR